MKKKNKNKARKSITAVGAVVAAGLTPGIVTGAPAPEPQGTDIKLTAADAVSINGEMYDFDDLFAMNQADSVPVDQIVVVYGSPKAMKALKEKEKKKKEKAKEQGVIDSLNNEILILQNEIEDLREQTRNEVKIQEYIQRAIRDSYKLVYGPPPPLYHSEADMLRNTAANDKDEALSMVVQKIMDYCSTMTDSDKPIGAITQNGNIVRDLKMQPSHMEELSKQIENLYDVQVSPDMMKRLGTLKNIARFIVESATPIRKE